MNYILSENLNALCKRMLDHVYDRVMYEEKLSVFSIIFYEIDFSDWSIKFYVKDQISMVKEMLYTISFDKTRVLINAKSDSRIIVPELYQMFNYHLEHYKKIMLAKT